jgi:hypothetical protein
MEAQREQWEKMLSVAIKAIVVIRVCTCRSFDTHKVSYRWVTRGEPLLEICERSPRTGP